jgi:Domain of unknown function (DUF1992)
MALFDLLAERKIAEAVSRGELDDLPGAGRPLELDEDKSIPEDLRVAYRILKNAGFVPPEVARLRQIADLERLVKEGGDAAEKEKLLQKIALLRTAREARPVRRRAKT